MVTMLLLDFVIWEKLDHFGAKGPFTFGDDDTDFWRCNHVVRDGFIVINVTARTWWQKKTHRCRQVRMGPQLTHSSSFFSISDEQRCSTLNPFHFISYYCTTGQQYNLFRTEFPNNHRGKHRYHLCTFLHVDNQLMNCNCHSQLRKEENLKY